MLVRNGGLQITNSLIRLEEGPAGTEFGRGQPSDGSHVGLGLNLGACLHTDHAANDAEVAPGHALQQRNQSRPPIAPLAPLISWSQNMATMVQPSRLAASWSG